MKHKIKPFVVPTAHRWAVQNACISFLGEEPLKVDGRYIRLPATQRDFIATVQLHVRGDDESPLPGEWIPPKKDDYRAQRYVHCIAWQFVASNWLGELRAHCEATEFSMQHPSGAPIANYTDVHRRPPFGLTPRGSFEPDPFSTYAHKCREAMDAFWEAYLHAEAHHAANVSIRGRLSPELRLIGYRPWMTLERNVIHLGAEPVVAAIVIAER